MAGLWGSGNVVTERELMEDGTNTLYTMWTGQGLVGPRAGESLEPYPALWGRRTLEAFVAEFGDAELECLVMIEAPRPEMPCQRPCQRVRQLCGQPVGQQCLNVCTDAEVPALEQCLAQAIDCQDAMRCIQP